MAANNELVPVDTGTSSDEDKLVEECEEFESNSYSWMSSIRRDWPYKESMLLGTVPEDQASKTTKAKIFNPALSTMIIERSSRVMAQEPVGRAFANSKDDVGKNILMNLLLKYFQKHATEEGSHLLKLRLMDVYSHVYGSIFGLVPWRINSINGYRGPELLPIAMRDVRPQPGKRTIDKSDEFGVRSVVSLNWLKNQDKGVWRNIDAVIADYKDDPGESGRSSKGDQRSYIEQARFPSRIGDPTYGDVEIFTQYRHDQWITWAPRVPDKDQSKPWLLRVVKNPYPRGYLPIVKKDAFPLIDSIIGLGDFERGKTLQFAMNSLINLYMDGVKYAIFPPLHINLDGVDAPSIKWGAGEKWYMNNPNADVQVMDMKTTEWLNTFSSTYGFLETSIQNLSGSTTTNETKGSEPSLGKTPQALQQYALSESARDEWDRFCMEDTINQVYERWTALITEKMEVPMTMRIFGSEIKDLENNYKDEKILDVFKSGNRGNLTISNKELNDGEEIVAYDYELDSGSTMRKGQTDEGQAANDLLQDVIQAPFILQEIRAKGGDINLAELVKRRAIGDGLKDWDKIIKMPPDEPASNTMMPSLPGIGGQGSTPEIPGQPVMPGQPSQPMPQTPPGAPGQPMPQAPNQNGPKPPSVSINFKDLPPDGKIQAAANANIQLQPGDVAMQPEVPVQTPSQAPTNLPQPGPGIKDPAIAQVAQQILGGTGGIPPQ